MEFPSTSNGSHCDDPGNSTADHLAKKAVGPDKVHPFQHLLSQEKGFIRQRVQKGWEQEWNNPKNRGNFRRVDITLPLIRTRCHGIELMCSYNSEPATHGWQHTASYIASGKTTSVNAELKKQWSMFYWTAHH